VGPGDRDAAAAVALLWPVSGSCSFWSRGCSGPRFHGRGGAGAGTRAQEPTATDEAAATRARLVAATLIAAVAIASLTYRLVVAHNLQQTAALFVGIPALLAIVVVFGVSPRSATGVACKAVTVGLLVSMLFLGEGMVCVIMSAPLFYVIAVAVADLMHEASLRNRPAGTKLFSCLIVLAIVPMSLEGVTGVTTVNRDVSVTESRIVHASSHAVEQALFEPPRFERVLPLYCAPGFLARSRPGSIGAPVERAG
jgi:hypothetical protein